MQQFLKGNRRRLSIDALSNQEKDTVPVVIASANRPWESKVCFDFIIIFRRPHLYFKRL
jgi:hypothetical protein